MSVRNPLAVDERPRRRTRTSFKILVVESDRQMRQSVVKFLRADGYTVQAVAMLANLVSAVGDKPPADLLIASIDSDGSPAVGLGICRQFLERTPRAKVLIIPDRLIVRKQVESYDWIALQKPFSKDRLLQKVKHLLAGC
jgi:DNA-binding response OmpR family regulator